jgi:plasmid stabilization system protein ParE
MRRAIVRVTRNFARNLEDLRQFAIENLAANAFDSFVDDLFDEITPSLERFPDMGGDFRTRNPQSIEGRRLLDRLDALVGEKTAIREYFAAHYIILYAHRGRAVYLLSVKHGRQLSFDLGGHWH